MKKKLTAVFVSLLFIHTIIMAVSALSITPLQARKLASGTEVTVGGYAASACCNDLTGFENEFYLYSGTNGICVEIPQGEKIELYENLEVTGTVINKNGEIRLLSSELKRLEGESTEVFKRLTVKEASDYGIWGGSFVRVIGTALNMHTENGVISGFDLSDEKNSIPVIIESGILSLSTGYTYKQELTEMLRYKREVVVNGFVYSHNGKTVIRIKDCDDIDVKYHTCIFGEEITEKEPSCGIEGLSVKICLCGKRTETVLPALQHSFKDTVEIKPTCAIEGISARTCKNCSYRLETPIAKTEHSYRETIEEKATCANEGIYVRYCTGCTFREETVIPKLQHSFKEKTEKNATCTESGIFVKYCSGCTFREETVIPKLQHSFKEKTVKKATCTESGIFVKYCSGCTFREETVIPKLQHSFKEKTEKNATCTESGIFVKYCSGCTFREETVIPKTEHKLKEITQKKATCTENGIEVQRCSECSYETKKEIPLLSHEYETVTEKASFNKSGKTSLRCKNCKDEKNITILPAVTKYELSQDSFVYDGNRHTPEITVSDSDGKSITDFSVSFSEGTKIGKQKVTVELTGNYSGKKTLSYKIIPADVKVVNRSISGKNASLTFGQVENANGYRIYLYENGSLTSLKTTSVTDCTVSLPRYNTTCTLIIKAYTQTADGIMWSEGHSFNIRTAPEKVSGIKADADFCSVRLSWKESDGALGYRVYIRKSNGKYKKLATVSGTSYEAISLSGAKNYTFAVKPYGRENGVNLWSEPVYKDVSTPQSKVTTFSAKESYYHVNLSWRSVKNADGYRLYIYNEKKNKYTILAKPEDTTFCAENLNSGTTYRFAVRPYIEKGGKTYLGECEYITVTTKLKKPVLVASSKKSGSNSLSWNRINGASGYEIYYSFTKDGKFKKLKDLTANSYTHSGIKKTCYYKVRAYKTVDGKKLYGSFSIAKRVIK